jgi:type I restriction enzyme, S subunit
MIGWQEVLLEEIADELTVGYVGSMASEYVPSGIPFLRSLNIEPLRVNKNDLIFITPEFHKRISKSRLSPGDVVIVRTGKPGTCTIIPEWLPEANCSDLVIVRCGKRINNRFLAYYVNTAASNHIAAHLVGAVQQHFNVGAARTLKMNLPPINEQLAIVDVLSALDNKIELNQRMNDTLEGIAQALFKSWFVDFDPVKAKVEGRKPEGMDDTVAAFFPSNFSASSLGLIPEEWEAIPFSEIIQLIGGGTPKTSVSEYWGGNIPWFSVADAPAESDVFVINTEKYITQSGLDNSSARLLPMGTTIITARGTVGRIALVGVPMAMNQSCYGIKGIAGMGDLFIYYATKSLLSKLKARTHGSVFDTITRDTFTDVSFVRPPSNTIDRFESQVAPLFKRIQSNLYNISTLKAIRDHLLPRLISGKLRVEEVSETVEVLAL